MARSKGIGEGRVILSLTALEAAALLDRMDDRSYRFDRSGRLAFQRARDALAEAVAEETRKAAERSAIMIAHDEGASS